MMKHTLFACVTVWKKQQITLESSCFFQGFQDEKKTSIDFYATQRRLQQM